MKLKTKNSEYLGSEISESEQSHMKSVVNLTENNKNKKKYSTNGENVPIILSNSTKNTYNLGEQRIMTGKSIKYKKAAIVTGNNDPKIIIKQVEKNEDAECQKSFESQVSYTEEIGENEANKIIDEGVTRKRKKRRKRKPRNKLISIYNEIDRNSQNKYNNISESCLTNKDMTYITREDINIKNNIGLAEASNHYRTRDFDYIMQDHNNFELASINQCNHKSSSNNKDQNASAKRRCRKHIVEGNSNLDTFDIEFKKPPQMEYETKLKYFDSQISTFQQNFNTKSGKNDETIEPYYSVHDDLILYDELFASEDSGLSDLIESGKGENSKSLQSKNNIFEQNGKWDYSDNRKNHEDKSQNSETFQATSALENLTDNKITKFESKVNVDLNSDKNNKHGLILPKGNSLLTKEDNQYREGVSQGIVSAVNKEYLWNPEIIVVDGKVYCLDSCECTDLCPLCHSDKNNSYDHFTEINDSDVDVSNSTSKSSVCKLNSENSSQDLVSLTEVKDFAEYLLTKNFVRPRSDLSAKEVRTLHDTSFQRSNSESISDKNIILLDDMTLHSKSNSLSVKEVQVSDDAILEKSNNNLTLDKDTLLSDDAFQKSNSNLTWGNDTVLSDSTSNKDILLLSDDIPLQRSNSNLTELPSQRENLTFSDSNDQIIIKNKPVKNKKILVKSLSQSSTKEGTAIIIDKQMHIFKNPTDETCYGIFPVQLTKDEELLEIEMHDPFSPGEGFLLRNTYHLKRVDAVSLQFNVEPSLVNIKCENEITASNCTNLSIVDPSSVNIKSENENTATNCTSSNAVNPIVHSFEKNKYSVTRSFDKIESSDLCKPTTQIKLDAFFTPKRL